MFKKIIAGFFVAVLGSFSTQTASAITFDLTSASDTTHTSFTIFDTTNTYSLIATGFISSGPKSVNRDSDGLGVYSGIGDDEQVDGNGPDETLRLDLGSPLFQLVSASFTRVGSDDDFTLTVDGSYKGQADIPNSGTYTFAGTYIGQLFDFGVASSNDDYKLSSVSFNWTGQRSQNGNTVVPEPASMLLLGSGLFGVGAIRKRLSPQ